MIGGLKGLVKHKGAGFIVLDVGGVGYKVYVTGDTYAALEEGTEADLYTHLAVRAEALTLYGFPERDALRIFELLISVSGIGPKSALGILSLADTGTLTKAISAGESAYLTKVSGIGRKNAEKIILELRDKLGGISTDEERAHMSADAEVLEALEALGYGEREAREAVKNLSTEETDTGTRLKEALGFLSKR